MDTQWAAKIGHTLSTILVHDIEFAVYALLVDWIKRRGHEFFSFSSSDTRIQRKSRSRGLGGKTDGLWLALAVDSLDCVGQTLSLSQCYYCRTTRRWLEIWRKHNDGGGWG